VVGSSCVTWNQHRPVATERGDLGTVPSKILLRPEKMCFKQIKTKILPPIECISPRLTLKFGNGVKPGGDPGGRRSPP